MTDRTEIVGVRLTPTEREKFEEYLTDSNEFDSMSRFFRTVAHRYVATEDEEQSLDPEKIIEAVDTAVSPLAERMDQIEDHVISIDSNVRDDDKIDKLARDIYSSLPTHADETELTDLDDIGQYANASDLAVVQAISTPDMWSEFFDEELQDVRRACARMLEYYPDVKFAREDSNEAGRQFPSHDDVNISEFSNHTDFSHHGEEERVSVSNQSKDRGNNTVRRFYKIEDN